MTLTSTLTSSLTSHLTRLALVLQVADLATFLVAVRLHPVLLRFEVGIIQSTYVEGGALGAIAFKLAGVAVIFAALAIYRGRWTPAVLAATAVVGLVGALANVSALLEVSRTVIGA